MKTLSDKPKVCCFSYNIIHSIYIVSFLFLFLLLLSSIASSDVIGYFEGSLICSEPVVQLPVLRFQDSDGQAYPVIIAGSVPGASFTLRLDIHDTISDGTATFSLVRPLLDRAGNEGTEITGGQYLSIKVLPKARIIMSVFIIDGEVIYSSRVEK